MNKSDSLANNISTKSKFLTPMKGKFGKKEVECSFLLTMPKLINNYVASFLNTKKECLYWALMLKHYREETGLQCRQMDVACSNQKLDEKHCFLEPVIRLDSNNTWKTMINWLEKHPQCYQKITEILDTVLHRLDDYEDDLIKALSSCKNLKRLQTSDIDWYTAVNESKISNELECLELTSSYNNLTPFLIEKVFPKLKSLKASFQISFYEREENMIDGVNQDAKTFKELKQKYSDTTIHLRFDPGHLDTVIEWCENHAELMENITVLNGSRCPLDENNKDQWKVLIEKLPNLDYLVINKIATSCVLTAKDSKLRRIGIMYDISGNLTLENLPDLENLSYETMTDNVILTLKGIPKLNKINWYEIKRPLTEIENEGDYEDEVYKCKVVDEDF